MKGGEGGGERRGRGVLPGRISGKTSDKAPAETISFIVVYSESCWLTMRLVHRYMIVQMNRSLSHWV